MNTRFRGLQEDYDYRREPDFDENNAEYRKDCAVEEAENHLRDAIKAGNDVLINFNGPYNKNTYPLHTFVGEVGEKSAVLLLKACAHAMAGPIYDHSTSELLRDFVESVCKQYGEDQWESFLE
jgi:hypothetical protein